LQDITDGQLGMQDFWRRFRRDRLAVIGLGMILVLLVEALIQWTAILSKRKAAMLHESPYVATRWAAGTEGD